MKPDKQRSLGVYARMAIDLRVGISYSVLNNSKLSKYVTKDKNSKDLITYGPWHFPTFWFWYERMKEIRNFKPKEYICFVRLKQTININ